MKAPYLYRSVFVLLLSAVTFISCIEDDPELPPFSTSEPLDFEGTQITFLALQQRMEQSQGIGTFFDPEDPEALATISNEEDAYIQGYVVSNDQSGNFFKELIIQNKIDDESSSADPRLGVRVDVDVRSLFTQFDVGRKVNIRLAGLTVTEDNGVMALGQLDSQGAFGRISRNEVDSKIFRTATVETIIPKIMTIGALQPNDLNTLIQLQETQFSDTELGKTFAGEKVDEFDGERLLTSCVDGNSMILSSSTFADFKSEVLPQDSGTITGIYTKNFFGDTDNLAIRDPEDILFEQSRCAITNAVTINQTIPEIRALENPTSIIDIGFNDWAMEGYVISSDQEDNFARRIVIQDASENPTAGIQLLVDKFDTFQQFPVGAKVIIKLDRLALGKTEEGILSLGYRDGDEVTEIPETVIGDFIVNTSESATIVPVAASSFQDAIPESILVQFDAVEVRPNELNQAYAFPTGNDDAVRSLLDCDDLNTVSLPVSGNASFANSPFPTGNGTVTGVFGSTFDGVPNRVYIRSTADVVLSGDYQDCSPNTESTAIIISEIGDPDNDTAARFIEIYNADTTTVDITGWTLARYTNDATAVGALFAFTGVMEPGQVVVLTENQVTFESTYGFAADIVLSGSAAGVAASNGDDNFELRDASGTLIDVFGVVGIDGTGTNHEFEDGRANRLPSVTEGNTTYTFEEWEIFNDSGDAGTTNAPQDAPDNFTPGVR